MKKIARKTAGVLSVLLLSMSLLTGCDTSGGSVSGNQSGGIVSANIWEGEVMKIGEYSVTMQDMYLYLIQYIYNNSTSPADLNEASQATVINQTINQMKLELVEYQLAIQTDITLTEEELATVERTTDLFCNTFGEEFLNSYGIDRECVYGLFERQLYISGITNKAVDDLAADYVSQFEQEYADMKFHSVYYALFPSLKYDADGQIVLDASGNAVLLTETEMEQQLALAEEFRKRAAEGMAAGDADASMEALVEEYNIGFCSGIERNYDGAYIAELNEVIDGLEIGEISDVVKTDAGYMIVRMDNPDDTEYKEYMIQYLSYQSAGKLLPTMQDTWMTQSGVISVQPSDEALASLDLIGLCTVMNEQGLVMMPGGAQ